MQYLVDELNSVYCYYKGNYVEFYENCTWARLAIVDRFDLLREYQNIADLIHSHGYHFSLTSSWRWTEVTYDGMKFRNDNRVYEFFITKSKNQSDNNIIENISDTVDPLYDYGLFALCDAINNSGKYCPKFTNSCRTLYGFSITVYSKKMAIDFYKTNPFKRTMEVEKIENRKYKIKIFMDDKIPENISLVNLKKL